MTDQKGTDKKRDAVSSSDADARPAAEKTASPARKTAASRKTGSTSGKTSSPASRKGKPAAEASGGAPAATESSAPSRAGKSAPEKKTPSAAAKSAEKDAPGKKKAGTSASKAGVSTKKTSGARAAAGKNTDTAPAAEQPAAGVKTGEAPAGKTPAAKEAVTAPAPAPERPKPATTPAKAPARKPARTQKAKAPSAEASVTLAGKSPEASAAATASSAAPVASTAGSAASATRSATEQAAPRAEKPKPRGRAAAKGVSRSAGRKGARNAAAEDKISAAPEAAADKSRTAPEAAAEPGPAAEGESRAKAPASASGPVAETGRAAAKPARGEAVDNASAAREADVPGDAGAAETSAAGDAAQPPAGEKKRRGRSRRGGRGRKRAAAAAAAAAEAGSLTEAGPLTEAGSLAEEQALAESAAEEAGFADFEGLEGPGITEAVFSGPEEDEEEDEDLPAEVPAQTGRSGRGRGGRGRGGKEAKEGREAKEGKEAKEVREKDAVDDDETAPSKIGRRKMFVSVQPEEQVEVVLTEEGQVQEYYVEMLHQAKTKGNIYKGVIHNVDPNLQAAFVNYGAVKNGFLQIDEVHPEYYVTAHEEGKGRKYPAIQKVLKPGQEVLVQVVKEPAGTKGAFLTTYLSLAGRFLVLTPGREQIGVSRKVENEGERARLRELLEGLNPGPGLGVIVRTVSLGVGKTSLQRDLQYLKRTWKDVRGRGTTEKSPCLVHQELDLTTRAVRDYLTEEVAEVWLDDERTAASVSEIAEALFPRKQNLVRLHKDSGTMLFERFNLQRQLDQIHSREVSLPSGGRLVIDATEALTAIDINSGRSGGKSNFEDMAYRTNMEAAKMIPLQLRLRDIGGQVVADFIEMRDKNHWRDVEKTLRAGMKVDRARYDVGKIGPFGLLEIVRQRLGSSAISISTEPCPYCNGTGVRRNMEWQCQQALREIQRELRAAQTQNQTEIVHQAEPTLAMHLLNHKRQRLLEMEQSSGIRIEIQVKHAEVK